MVKKRALCSQLMHMAVSSQCRRVSCSPLEVLTFTLQWAAVSQAHFFLPIAIVAYTGWRSSSTSSGCRSSSRSNWLVGPLGSTRPRSYLSKALSPTLRIPPASRCESFSFLPNPPDRRRRRYSLDFFLQRPQCSVRRLHVVTDMNAVVAVRGVIARKPDRLGTALVGDDEWPDIPVQGLSRLRGNHRVRQNLHLNCHRISP